MRKALPTGIAIFATIVGSTAVIAGSAPTSHHVLALPQATNSPSNTGGSGQAEQSGEQGQAGEVDKANETGAQGNQGEVDQKGQNGDQGPVGQQGTADETGEH